MRIPVTSGVVTNAFICVPCWLAGFFDGLVALLPYVLRVCSLIPTQTMAVWHYYNDQGDKVTVTGKELKELARTGQITPGTMIETEDGKTAPAKKVQGLKFATAQPTDIESVAPTVNIGAYDLAPLPLEPKPLSVPVGFGIDASGKSNCKTSIKQSTEGGLLFSLVWGVLFGSWCIYFGLSRENGFWIIVGFILFVLAVGRFLVDLVKMVKK